MSSTLNIVGAGAVGQTLAALWCRAGVVSVGGVTNQTLESAEAAVQFIGAGQSFERAVDAERADAWMLSLGDDAIERCCDELAAAGCFAANTLVFHCSGAHSSSLLASAKACGALVASLHPVKSFVDAGSSRDSFAGTPCALEGAPEAVSTLRSWLLAVSARVFEIDPAGKSFYHAGSVFACNYLNALVEVAIRCHERAGLARGASLEILEPLVRETAENVFERGPAAALTGPIARGDAQVVVEQLDALAAQSPQLATLYAALARVTVDLAERHGQAPAAALEEIRTRASRIRG